MHIDLYIYAHGALIAIGFDAMISTISYFIHIYMHPLHDITLHYITLRYVTLHYNTVHNILVYLHTYMHACMHEIK